MTGTHAEERAATGSPGPGAGINVSHDIHDSRRAYRSSGKFTKAIGYVPNLAIDSAQYSPIAKFANYSQEATTPNQSHGGHGIKSWTEKRDLVKDEDVVIWHTFGFNHIPRVEDFPIMPAEIAQMHLKPYSVCTFNATDDVPPSSQAFNRSVLYE
ncbi:hypothetical protein N0V82_007294 [Gnomoniopsis sp. IMI 355080]|nr:hypothetical protein N0V82_007294 [Gnomoniopsis sp. IMI 355080]